MALVIALTIEGLGKTSTVASADRALRLSLVNAALSTPARTYYACLDDWPDQVESELDVLGGITSQASLSFTLGNLDADDPEAADLRSFFLLSRPPASYGLGANYTATAATIDLELLPGAQSPSANDVLWIGREAIRINSVSSSGSTRTCGVTRGIFGTTGQALVQGRDRFYRTSPTPLDRLVTLYAADTEDDASEVVVWRGVLETAQLDATMMTVEVSCLDLLSYVSNQQLGQGRIDTVARFQSQARLDENSPSIDLGAFTGGTEGAGMPYPPAIYNLITLAVGKSIYRVVASNGEERGASAGVAGNSTWVPFLGGPADVSVADYSLLAANAGRVGVDVEGVEAGKVYQCAEVLVSGASNGINGEGSGVSPFRNGQGSTDTDAQSDWFGDIVRNILCSTGEARYDASLTPSHRLGGNGDFDCLPGAWGLGVPDAFIEHDSFENIKRRWPWAQLNAGNFILGTPGDDDELPEAAEVISRLVKAGGCYLYTGPTGLITLGVLADLGTVDAEVDETNLDPEGLDDVEVRPAELGPVHRIESNLYRLGLSEQHGLKISGREFTGETEARYKRQVRPDEVDAGHYGDPELDEVPDAVVSSFVSAMRQRYALVSDFLPQYTIRLRHDTPSVLAGQWIRLTHPAIPSPDDGSRGISQHRCLVIRSERDTSTVHIDGAGGATAGQVLTVVDYYPVTRNLDVVLPSWEVGSVTSATVFEIEPNSFGGDGTSGGTDATLWRDASDGDYWVHLWTPGGVLKSTDGPQRGNISGSTVTLTSAWQASAVDVTPLSNDVIRVASYDDAGDWVTEHDYTWIANEDAAVGATKDDASKWGV